MDAPVEPVLDVPWSPGFPEVADDGAPSTVRRSPVVVLAPGGDLWLWNRGRALVARAGTGEPAAFSWAVAGAGELTSFAPLADGGVLAALECDELRVLARLDAEGDLAWRRTGPVTGPSDPARLTGPGARLQVDSDGAVLLVTAAGGRAAVARVDLTTGETPVVLHIGDLGDLGDTAGHAGHADVVRVAGGAACHVLARDERRFWVRHPLAGGTATEVPVPAALAAIPATGFRPLADGGALVVDRGCYRWLDPDGVVRRSLPLGETEHGAAPWRVAGLDLGSAILEPGGRMLVAGADDAGAYVVRVTPPPAREPCYECDGTGDCWNCDGSGVLDGTRCGYCRGGGRCEVCAGARELPAGAAADAAWGSLVNQVATAMHRLSRRARAQVPPRGGFAAIEGTVSEWPAGRPVVITLRVEAGLPADRRHLLLLVETPGRGDPRARTLLTGTAPEVVAHLRDVMTPRRVVALARELAAGAGERVALTGPATRGPGTARRRLRLPSTRVELSPARRAALRVAVAREARPFAHRLDRPIDIERREQPWFRRHEVFDVQSPVPFPAMRLYVAVTGDDDVRVLTARLANLHRVAAADPPPGLDDPERAEDYAVFANAWTCESALGELKIADIDDVPWPDGLGREALAEVRELRRRFAAAVGPQERRRTADGWAFRSWWVAMRRLVERELVVPPDGRLRRTDTVHAVDMPLPAGRLWKVVAGRLIPIG
jgi:hypothetical protein